jgi:hypothetical protein
MANKRLKTTPIDGDLASEKIKQKYGSINQFARSIGISDRSIRMYIKNNAIPAKIEMINAFSKLMDTPIEDPVANRLTETSYEVGFDNAYQAGFKAGYNRCLSELSGKFLIWINTLEK